MEFDGEESSDDEKDKWQEFMSETLNVIFVTDPATVKKAGPDYEATITKVQQGLSIPVMQELDARVDIDKETPSQVASEYLKESGYTQ